MVTKEQRLRLQRYATLRAVAEPEASDGIASSIALALLDDYESALALLGTALDCPANPGRCDCQEKVIAFLKDRR